MTAKATHPNTSFRFFALLIVLFGLVAAGCTQTKAFRATGDFERPPQTVRVLLMPPDVELYEITAAGLMEPKADWTAAGKANVRAGLGRAMRERDAEMIDYEAPRDQVALIHPEDVQLVKLHEAVGSTILQHKYLQYYDLPTKKDTFDWTLGEGANTLRARYGADYALFVYFRDSFASAGRVAFMIVGSLFGAYVPGGQQIGFASLVDLQTGEVVWFNVLQSESGDLRQPDLAYQATARLLNELPL